MILYLLLSIAANLLVGFCAAVRVRQLVQHQPAVITIEQADLFLGEISNEDPIEIPPTRDHPHNKLVVPEEVIPYEYLAVLENEAIESNGLVEATAQVLRLEIGRYRTKLIAIENRLREAWYQPTEQVLQEIADDLDALNLDWLDKQAEASQHLDGSTEGLGAYSDIGRRLCDTLFDQTAQIETTLSNLQQLDFTDSLNDVCRKLVLEIGRLIDLAHDLRDKMTETIVTVLRAEKRLDTVDKKMKMDSVTGLRNRTGFECQLFEWWRDDIRRERALSIGLIDVDGFRKINERLSTEVGDEVIAALGGFIGDIMRSDRGFEFPMRLEGQRFILFFGDVGPRGATSSIERIRQSIQATSFQYDGEEIDLLASAGVAEVKPDDTVAKLMTRVTTALRTAKKNGRNRTFIDEGHGPQAIDPPEYPVRPRVIRIGE
ncbi:GGDEF domain-containing protein [Bremerella cremea]|uniref:diguanylate cyclase n=1 Tax=Bremerella cremea TaxID=1031537 RepID=A0A368KNI9_9BACT|nr:GGDEF domain-containing protein [Bremerella cremea]RCS41402.1 GGDEF domain-containing protein [Bremerella cremea]